MSYDSWVEPGFLTTTTHGIETSYSPTSVRRSTTGRNDAILGHPHKHIACGLFSCRLRGSQLARPGCASSAFMGYALLDAEDEAY